MFQCQEHPKLVQAQAEARLMNAIPSDQERPWVALELYVGSPELSLLPTSTHMALLLLSQAPSLDALIGLNPPTPGPA